MVDGVVTPRHYEQLMFVPMMLAKVLLDTHAGAAAMFDRSKTSVGRSALAALLTLSTAMQTLTPALAGPNEQAKRLFDRITGTPPSATVLSQMASDISGNNAIGAAQLAMQDSNFYN